MVTKELLYLNSDFALRNIVPLSTEPEQGRCAVPALTLYSDRITQFLRDSEDNAIELRWLEEANAMSEAQFRAAIERLADLLERDRLPHVLVDMSSLKFRPAEDFEQWRQAKIIPRYNNAGVSKFAFLVPKGADYTVESGTLPAVEGSATFQTGYFSTREGAVSWFAASPAPGADANY